MSLPLQAQMLEGTVTVVAAGGQPPVIPRCCLAVRAQRRRAPLRCIPSPLLTDADTVLPLTKMPTSARHRRHSCWSNQPAVRHRRGYKQPALHLSTPNPLPFEEQLHRHRHDVRCTTSPEPARTPAVVCHTSRQSAPLCTRPQLSRAPHLGAAVGGRSLEAQSRARFKRHGAAPGKQP